jgi:hypothetical protein
VTIDGVEYYSETSKYSVLEYVHEMREKGTISESKEALFGAMLEYGAAAQNVFDYKTNRLANATYYKISVENGTLADGTTMGRYVAGEKAVLKANPAPEGKEFAYWVDELGEVISEEETAEVCTEKSQVYSAVYVCIHNEIVDAALRRLVRKLV